MFVVACGCLRGRASGFSLSLLYLKEDIGKESMTLVISFGPFLGSTVHMNQKGQTPRETNAAKIKLNVAVRRHHLSFLFLAIIMTIGH